MRLSHILLSSFLVLFLSACGYKPSSHYAKEQIKGKVFVNLQINLEDPRNAVLIKDAMNEMLVHRLDSKLVYDRALADTVMDLNLKSVSMQVLQDDAQGYNKLYKAEVDILVKYKNSESSESFVVSGDYDFSIDAGSTITDTRRFEAIKNAASKALEDVISKIVVKSFKKNK